MVYVVCNSLKIGIYCAYCVGVPRGCGFFDFKHYFEHGYKRKIGNKCATLSLGTNV